MPAENSPQKLEMNREVQVKCTFNLFKRVWQWQAISGAVEKKLWKSTNTWAQFLKYD